jgi:hypothetical protein
MCSFLCGIGPSNGVRGCAKERGEGENQRGRRDRRIASESTKDAVGVCELRQRNSAAWRCFWFGKKERIQRRAWGFYRRPIRGGGVRVSGRIGDRRAVGAAVFVVESQTEVGND